MKRTEADKIASARYLRDRPDPEVPTVSMANSQLRRDRQGTQSATVGLPVIVADIRRLPLAVSTHFVGRLSPKRAVDSARIVIVSE